ncbi:hypothetical protein [Sphingobium sp.]|uniref:hypothetical protein n=1 Tax=Sphingobium sp. TaxID=1912891 RepID=UPI002ED45FBF
MNPKKIEAVENDAATIARRLKGAERDTMAWMLDHEMEWSATHGWPSICDDMSAKGLIEITGQTVWGNRPQYRSVITDLGREVRAILNAEPR